MKQELTIQGRVELTRQELTEAVVGYAEDSKIIAKAIAHWLSAKHNLVAVRVRYSKDSAVADIKRTVAEGVPKFSDDPKVKRITKGGFTRRNVGVFDFIKNYLADAKNLNRHKVNFNEVYSVVKDQYPSMEEKRLSMYLHDKRMLPGIIFRDKVVTF